MHTLKKEDLEWKPNVIPGGANPKLGEGKKEHEWDVLASVKYKEGEHSGVGGDGQGQVYIGDGDQGWSLRGNDI